MVAQPCGRARENQCSRSDAAARGRGPEEACSKCGTRGPSWPPHRPGEAHALQAVGVRVLQPPKENHTTQERLPCSIRKLPELPGRLCPAGTHTALTL